MSDSQSDGQPLLVFDPIDGSVTASDSEFYAALFDAFDVEQAETVTALAADCLSREYAAVLYRWRSGAVADLTAVLDALPAALDAPFIVAGPDDPTLVRNALVADVDDYVPADTTSTTKLDKQLSTPGTAPRNVGVEAADTAALHGAIVDQMQDTAWVLDTKLRVSYVNRQLVARLGVSAADIIGTSIETALRGTVLTDDAYNRFRNGVQEVLDGHHSLFRMQLDVTPKEQPAYTTDVLVQPYRNPAGEIIGVVGIGRDISRQLDAQQQTERQNNLFREAQQLANVGSWALDTETSVFELTDEVYSIYELSVDFEPTLDSILAFHPEHRTEIRSAFDEVRAGQAATFEAAVRTPKGTNKWVRIHGTPIIDDGEVTEIIGSVQDITDRQQLETELKESVSSLRALYRISADTTLTFEDRIEQVLALTCRRLGLKYGFLTAIDGGIQEIRYAHGDHERLQAGEQSSLSTAYCRKTINQESLLTVEDATAEGWENDPAYQTFGLACYLGGVVTVGGKRYGTLCFADSTARERSFSETELAFVEVLTKWVSYQLERRETETKLRALQETTQAFLTAEDETAVAALAMDAAVEILELPLTGLWKYNEEEHALFPVAETDQSREEFGGQPTFTADSGLVWETFENGTVSVFDDVQSESSRFNTETAVKSELIIPVQSYGVLASATLEQRSFSELEVDLLRILATSTSAAMARVSREMELTRQNERLSEFTGYVSHDLRNPLSVAQGYVSQAIETDSADGLGAAVRAHSRMETLIEDMLLLARRGEVIGSVEPTAVETIVEDAWEAVDARSASLAVSGNLTLVADSSRLQQVFENLFRNSIEHGGPDVTITVDCQPDRLLIADNGCGFDTDPAALFGDDGPQKTGLGLSIVAAIVDAHGWSITARDGDPDGCAFEISGFEPAD